MNDIEKFCSNEIRFGVFQVGPTFDLGPFSVTATAHEFLLLVNKDSKKQPAMMGSLLIHQKKEKDTYKVLSEFVSSEREAFKQAIAIGTDGGENVIKAFSESCPTSTHLRCFIHLRDNMKEKAKPVGIDETNRKMICADIFEIQNGTIFEERTVDSDDEEEFFLRLQSLKTAWAEKIEKKRQLFYQWFMKYKANNVAKYMLKPVRSVQDWDTHLHRL